MKNETTLLIIQSKYQKIGPCLNEKNRRLWAATEAKALGRGGISLVHQATGISRPTINRGIEELEDEKLIQSKHQRQKGDNPAGHRVAFFRVWHTPLHHAE